MTHQSFRNVTRSPTVAPILTGHFREAAGYAAWRPRGTSDWLLVFTTSGCGRFGTAAGGECYARPGDLTLLRPGTLHDYGTAHRAEEWEFWWTHFLPRPHWQDWLSAWPDTDGCPGIVHAALPETERSEIARALGEMHHHALSGQARRDAFAMNALERALLCCDRALLPFGGSQMDERILRARAYLLEHLRTPVLMTTLAGRVGLSVSRLAHLFREQIGQTPQQFVESERMARAQQLLERTGRTVTAIADEVGFENPFYFSLRFKKHTGLSPRDWRQGRQNAQPDPEIPNR
ncbi:MAG: helix-turn-helix domain-containing protein [Cytophagales bacterium]|nr:helix-turn-helix domain-containing protein [Armatimonadota bacterium]